MEGYSWALIDVLQIDDTLHGLFTYTDVSSRRVLCRLGEPLCVGCDELAV